MATICTADQLVTKRKRSREDYFKVVINKVMEDLIESQGRNKAQFLELQDKKCIQKRRHTIKW